VRARRSKSLARGANRVVILLARRTLVRALIFLVELPITKERVDIASLNLL
jgi:hypothetical protein